MDEEIKKSPYLDGYILINNKKEIIISNCLELLQIIEIWIYYKV